MANPTMAILAIKATFLHRVTRQEYYMDAEFAATRLFPL